MRDGVQRCPRALKTANGIDVSWLRVSSRFVMCAAETTRGHLEWPGTLQGVFGFESNTHGIQELFKPAMRSMS